MPNIPIYWNVYFIIILAILGLSLGSFLNCFAYRYANEKSVSRGRSKCASCEHELKWTDLIPVFSWLFLKGRCRYCGEKISIKYLMAELILAIAFVSVYLCFGVSLNTIKFLILVSLLFTAAFTDMYSLYIPDRIHIIGIITAVIFCFFEQSFFKALLSTLINGLSIALPVLIIVILFEKITKKQAMGGGDIKLMFTIGLFFHWSLNILIIILGCIIGAVFGIIQARKAALSEEEPEDADAEIPAGDEKPSEEKEKEELIEAEDDEIPEGSFSFAPALCIAAFFVMLFGNQFLTWYLHLFGIHMH